MSAEERNNEEKIQRGMAQLPRDLHRQLPGSAGPTFNPSIQAPPDLLYKGVQNTPPPGYAQEAEKGDVNESNNSQLFKALRRQGYFMTEPFNATTTSKVLRPFESRTYLFIQNIDTVNDIILGFGNTPSVQDGLTIPPGAAYEPWTIPVNEIYIISSALTVKGFIIYSRE